MIAPQEMLTSAAVMVRAWFDATNAAPTGSALSSGCRWDFHWDLQLSLERLSEFSFHAGYVRARLAYRME
jgi:hypothetical protein